MHPTLLWTPQDPPSAFAPRILRSGVQAASQSDGEKAFAAPVLTPAGAEHLQETRAAPGLDTGSSPSPEGSPMQAQHHENPAGRLLAAARDRQLSPTTTEQHEPWSYRAGQSDGGGAVTGPSHTARLLPRAGSSPAAHRGRGEQNTLAAKSSANPDLFEGLRSRRAEPSGKVQAISGHYFSAL